jgi:hypothetical protein
MRPERAENQRGKKRHASTAAGAPCVVRELSPA